MGEENDIRIPKWFGVILGSILAAIIGNGYFSFATTEDRYTRQEAREDYDRLSIETYKIKAAFNKHLRESATYNERADATVRRLLQLESEFKNYVERHP